MTVDKPPGPVPFPSAQASTDGFGPLLPDGARRERTEPEAPVAGSEQRMVKALVGAILVVVVGFVMLIGAMASRGTAPVTASMPEPEQAAANLAPAEPQQPVADPLAAVDLPIELPFGGAARVRCLNQCRSAADADPSVCQVMCGRFSTLQFAHAVRLTTRSPESVAVAMEEHCENLKPVEHEQSVEEWDEQQLAIRRHLETHPSSPAIIAGEELRSRWSELVPLLVQTAAPEKSAPASIHLATEARKALCVRLSVTAVQLAILESARTGDSFSEIYYRGVERPLLANLLPQEGTLLKSLPPLNDGVAP